MKRRRIFGLFIVFCVACTIGCPVWAQTADPTTFVSSPANDAQIEVAKKELSAYQLAYFTMAKEKGLAAALRFFLTPDYEQKSAWGEKTLSANELLKRSEAAQSAARSAQPIAKSTSDKDTQGLPGGPNAVLRVSGGEMTPEKWIVEKDQIIVTERTVVQGTYTDAADAPGAAAQTPHKWKDIQTNRKTYRRTEQGLRLQKDEGILFQRFVDNKLQFQKPVPHIGF